MKKKILAIGLCLISVHAIAAPPKKCPGVVAIQTVGFNDGVKYWDLNDTWGASAKTRQVYDVPGKWDVYTGGIKATDEADARNQAKKILDSMYFVKGPFKVLHDTWLACEYQSGLGIGVYAMTPNRDVG